MTALKKPKIGEFYDREEISQMFGGNRQSALPFNNGDVVAGCFDPVLNPSAPEIVLVGRGRYKEKYAQRATEQNTPIPIFLKRANREYRFVGYFRATRYSVNREEVEEKNNSPRYNDDIAGVLYFEKATTV